MCALMYIILSFVRKQFFLHYMTGCINLQYFYRGFFSVFLQLSKTCLCKSYFFFSKIFQQTKTLKDNESDFVEVFYQTIKKKIYARRHHSLSNLTRIRTELLNKVPFVTMTKRGTCDESQLRR